MPLLTCPAWPLLPYHLPCLPAYLPGLPLPIHLPVPPYYKAACPAYYDCTSTCLPVHLCACLPACLPCPGRLLPVPCPPAFCLTFCSPAPVDIHLSCSSQVCHWNHLSSLPSLPVPMHTLPALGMRPLFTPAGLAFPQMRQCYDSAVPAMVCPVQLPCSMQFLPGGRCLLSARCGICSLGLLLSCHYLEPAASGLPTWITGVLPACACPSILLPCLPALPEPSVCTWAYFCLYACCCLTLPLLVPPTLPATSLTCPCHLGSTCWEVHCYVLIANNACGWEGA